MSTVRSTDRGLGLAVAIPKDVVKTAGDGRGGRMGYSSFWLNNPPGAHALSVLGEVAPLCPSLDLGVGVIPLCVRFDPDAGRGRGEARQSPAGSTASGDRERRRTGRTAAG